MIGGITYIGWFHTIVGIPAILAGLYLLIRDRFIYIDKGLAKFYLIATVITSLPPYLYLEQLVFLIWPILLL